MAAAAASASFSATIGRSLSLGESNCSKDNTQQLVVHN